MLQKKFSIQSFGVGSSRCICHHSHLYASQMMVTSSTPSARSEFDAGKKQVSAYETAGQRRTQHSSSSCCRFDLKHFAVETCSPAAEQVEIALGGLFDAHVPDNI